MKVLVAHDDPVLPHLVAGQRGLRHPAGSDVRNALGAEEFLTKPADIDALDSALRRLLGMSDPAS